MTETTADQPSNRKIIIAGIVGNVMEWYDFAVYGYFAVVIGKLFFPSDDPGASLIAAFGAFAAGFLARPLGGLVLGRLGDVIGRRRVLAISIYCMAVPTVVMGLMPTHETIGIAAPILLILLRIVQGLSVGGEYTSSSVFLAEHAPPGKRGLTTCWSLWGAVLGILIGSGVGALLSAVLDADQITAWGWRIPFLLGASIAVAGVLLRRGLSDDAPASKSAAPVREAFRDHLRPMARIVGLNLANGIAFYLIFVYSVTYIKSIDKLSGEIAFDLNTANMAILLLIVPFGAWLSDRFGRKPVIGAALAGLVVGAVPCFMLMHSTHPVSIFIGQFILTVIIGLFVGPCTATNVEQLPKAVRCTGLAMSYNLSIGIFGGTTPLVAAWLITSTGNPIAPAYYLLAAAAISLAVLFTLKETAHEPLA